MTIEYYGIEGDWSPLPTYLDSVWTNGCFDILHLGHLELLSKCREESNKLNNSLVFVGLDSDKRIKSNKGNDRPINSITTRVSMLLSLKYIDGIFVYDTDEELDSIVADIKPTKLIIGDDYKNKKVIGREHAKYIDFFTKIENMSTSTIIKKIREN